MKDSIKRLKLVTLFLAIPVLTLLILPAAIPAYSTTPAETENYYKAKCAVCHGTDGSGATAMGKKLNVRDLRSAEVQKKSDGELAGVIEKGKNKMPAYKTDLCKEKLQHMVGYIRSMAKK